MVFVGFALNGHPAIHKRSFTHSETACHVGQVPFRTAGDALRGPECRLSGPPGLFIGIVAVSENGAAQVLIQTELGNSSSSIQAMHLLVVVVVVVVVVSDQHGTAVSEHPPPDHPQGTSASVIGKGSEVRVALRQLAAVFVWLKVAASTRIQQKWFRGRSAGHVQSVQITR